MPVFRSGIVPGGLFTMTKTDTGVIVSLEKQTGEKRNKVLPTWEDAERWLDAQTTEQFYLRLR